MYQQKKRKRKRSADVSDSHHEDWQVGEISSGWSSPTCPAHRAVFECANVASCQRRPVMEREEMSVMSMREKLIYSGNFSLFSLLLTDCTQMLLSYSSMDGSRAPRDSNPPQPRRPLAPEPASTAPPPERTMEMDSGGECGNGVTCIGMESMIESYDGGGVCCDVCCTAVCVGV